MIGLTYHRTPDQARLEQLEYQLACQTWQIRQLGYVTQKLATALNDLAIEEQRNTELVSDIDVLHRLVAKLGIRGQAVFTKDKHLHMELMLADVVIAHAKPHIRHLLGYHFAKMADEIVNTVEKSR